MNVRNEVDVRVSTRLSGTICKLMLCRDKLKTQQLLEIHKIPMPPVTGDPTAFKGCLKSWKIAFLKPQFGALGQSVTQVSSASKLVTSLPSVVPGKMDPAILQKGIEPPNGWAGLSVRILVQRKSKVDS